MLVKTEDLRGLKVITLNEGKIVDDIDDVIYDPLEHKVKALIISGSGLFSEGEIIYLEDIKNIGKDAVIIPSEDVVKKIKDAPTDLMEIAEEDNYLTDTRVFTEDGVDLGKITDIYFDTITGQVIEFEVSSGIKDLTQGKKRIKVIDVITIGRDVTIVKAETKEEVENQVRENSIEGVINKAQQTISTKAPEVKQKLSEKVTELEGKIETKAEEISNSPKTQELMSRARKEVTNIQNKLNENKEKSKNSKLIKNETELESDINSDIK